MDRLFADVCDGVIALLVTISAYYVIGRWLPGVETSHSVLVVLLIWFLWNLTYLVGKHGQSWGRKLGGVKVVNNEGGSIGFWRALGRNLFEVCVSAPVFYLGFLWVILDRRKQAWHDKVFRTYVVRVVERGVMRKVASTVLIAIGVGLLAMEILVISTTGESTNVYGFLGPLMIIAGVIGLWRRRKVAQEQHPASV